jgi:hypothetical protein
MGMRTIGNPSSDDSIYKASPGDTFPICETVAFVAFGKRHVQSQLVVINNFTPMLIGSEKCDARPGRQCQSCGLLAASL